MQTLISFIHVMIKTKSWISFSYGLPLCGSNWDSHVEHNPDRNLFKGVLHFCTATVICAWFGWISNEDEIENSGDGDDGNKEDDYNGEDDVILMMMIVCAWWFDVTYPDIIRKNTRFMPLFASENAHGNDGVCDGTYPTHPRSIHHYKQSIYVTIDYDWWCFSTLPLPLGACHFHVMSDQSTVSFAYLQE